MSSRRKFLRSATFAGMGLYIGLRRYGQAGQTVSTVGSSGAHIGAPPPGYYPYSGISGPGRPLTSSSGSGGWHSGSAGVAYRGPFPPSYSTQPWLNYATGSAVEKGLLPPVPPLLELHVRDTIVCLGGDGDYYMTGSTGDNIWAFNDGVELWRSSDLKTWHYLGLVWSVEKDGTWEKEWRTLHDLPSRAVWAPEIHYVRGNYYICLSMAPSGTSILKSSTGKAEGPYVHAFSPDQPVTGGIDPTLFEDDDGKVYFTWGPATQIAELNPDMSGFAGSFRRVALEDPDHAPSHHAEKCVARGMNDLGHEGATLFKANGRYYRGAADSYEGRYSTCLAMSDNIYGPYHTRHESVPCAGGTGFFKDKEGRWWTSYFGNDTQSPFLEKPAILRINFDSQGKVILDNNQPRAVRDTGRKKV
jgi:xylan 1,4-beta-xylosidase